jgi:hypothetical protein
VYEVWIGKHFDVPRREVRFRYGSLVRCIARLLDGEPLETGRLEYGQGGRFDGDLSIFTAERGRAADGDVVAPSDKADMVFECVERDGGEIEGRIGDSDLEFALVLDKVEKDEFRAAEADGCYPSGDCDG